MDSNSRFQQIFDAAAEMDSAIDQSGFIERECGDDEALKSRLTRLLYAYQNAGSFLEPNVHGAEVSFSNIPFNGVEQNKAGSAGLDDQTFHLKAGARVGPYAIKKKLGEGGFGAVYLAWQASPVQRDVALKLIKPGMDSREVLVRFDAERQALAMMNHPGIAKVFDAGLTRLGRPWFALEFVDGQPITEFCDRHQLSITQRLSLFIDVCNAVQHAHQKGVIHRDLKPGNILVSSTDSKPLPKLIDFGVAKSLQQKLTAESIQTRQNQLLGTPLYMSPEQARYGATDVDVRSDIYSLGIILFELLVGSTPVTRDRIEQYGIAGFLEQMQNGLTIRPSQRLAEIASDETQAASRLATCRATHPAAHKKVVSGDLDWIVRKAIQTNREDRYDSVGDFSRDISRYLALEPVVARAPSRNYQFRRFVHRNLLPIVVATAFTSVLLVATMVSVSQARKASRSAAIATAAEASAVSDLLTHQRRAQFFTGISKMIAEDPRALPAVDAAIDRALDMLPKVFHEDPKTRHMLHMEIGRMLAQLGRFRDLSTIYQRATVEAEREFGAHDNKTRAAMSALASALLVTVLPHDTAAREKEIALGVRLLELEKGHPAPTKLFVVDALLKLGEVYLKYDNLDAAGNCFEEASSMTRLHRLKVTNYGVRTMVQQSDYKLRKGDVPSAIRFAKQADVVYQQLPYNKQQPHLRAGIRKALARAYFQEGHGPEAEALFLKALNIESRSIADRHPIRLRTMLELANVCLHNKKMEATKGYLDKGLSVIDSQVPHETILKIRYKRLLGLYFETIGKPKEARNEWQAAMALCATEVPAGDELAVDLQRLLEQMKR